MKFIQFIKIVKRNFFKVNIVKTIYLNFKMLPFKQAIHLPVLVGWRTELRNVKGRFIFDDGIELYPGIVTINIHTGPISTKYEHFVFCVPGDIVIHGTNIHFFVGMTLWINGQLELGGENVFGSHSLIACYKHISIGHFTGCSWNCEIYDTNFHFFRDLIANRVIKRNGKVFIGDGVFIGNKVVIGKGTYLCEGCVVSNNSLVNRSYKREGKNLLIGGNPAQILMTDFTRVTESGILNFDNEKELAALYD